MTLAGLTTPAAVRVEDVSSRVKGKLLLSDAQNERTSPASTSNAASRRLLLMKFGAIGDVVMTIPAAAAMHRAGYSVDWVASHQVAPVLGLYPWINVLPVDEPRLLRGSARERASGMFRLWQTLREQVRRCGDYDTVATLYYDPRYKLLSLPLRARRKVLLSRSDRRFALLPGRHHTDEYARIVCDRPDGETPGQLAPVPAPNLPPPPHELQSDRPRVVLVPAGARNVLRDDALRRWPIEHYVALASALLARGCEVLLLGGPDDRWASPYFAEMARTAGEKAFADLLGQHSLVETLALLDSATVTVTHDTGPLHLAGLTSTGIVTLFGPTDPHGRLPHRPNCLAIWGGEGFACRPCYDSRDYAPCTHNGCLAQITPSLVESEVLAMIDLRIRGQSKPPRVTTPEGSTLVQLAALSRPTEAV